MGRFAGHNVVADLYARPMIPLRIDWYVTVLDLGSWGALYTTGWDRQVFSVGHDAKAIKQTINQKRIYPPQTGIREQILAAAAPRFRRRRRIARRGRGDCAIAIGRSARCMFDPAKEDGAKLRGYSNRFISTASPMARQPASFG